MNKIIYTFIYLAFLTSPAFSQQATLKTGKIMSCFEFIDLYSKVVENIEDPTVAEQTSFEKATERMIGLVTGIEIGSKTRIILRERGINEWSIINDVQKSCMIAPNISIDESVLSLSIVNAALRNANSMQNQATWQSCQQYCNE